MALTRSLVRWLVRISGQLGQPLDGFWYRRGDGWNWVGRSEPPFPVPPEEALCHWENTGLAAWPPLPPAQVRRLRKLRVRRQRRQRALQLVAALNAQRDVLAHLLHRGPCQSMTAAQLQLGLVQMSEPGPERDSALEELENVLEQSARDLRVFYERRFYRYPQALPVFQRRWPDLPWERLRPLPLWFELLNWAQVWDDQVAVSEVNGSLMFQFRRKVDGQQPDLDGILSGFQAFAFQVDREAETLRVSLPASN